MVAYARGSQPCSSMYFVTVMLSAQSRTAPSNIASTGEARRTPSNGPSLRSAPMPEPTFADVDELVGPATPHFAYQLRARVHELVLDLPEEHPVRQYAEEKMELLDRLGHASSKGARPRGGGGRRGGAADAAWLERPPGLGARGRATPEIAMSLQGAS